MCMGNDFGFTREMLITVKCKCLKRIRDLNRFLDIALESTVMGWAGGGGLMKKRNNVLLSSFGNVKLLYIFKKKISY